MTRKLSGQPFYLLLMPLFFVLHGAVENFGNIPAGDLALLLLYYCIATIILAAIAAFFLRDRKQAALLAFLLMACYFFFGAVHDFLHRQTLLRWLGKYSVLLPVSAGFLTVLFLYIRKSPGRLRRFGSFLSILFLVYIFVDLWGLVVKIIHPPQNKLSVYGIAPHNDDAPCDTCARPDIYFLLFDEYAGSKSLYERFHFHNDIDSFFRQKGFRVQDNSHSNYEITPFSMASMLNMSYLRGIRNTRAITADDYAHCTALIKNNAVIRFLDAHGYGIVNYSIFDLAGNPSVLHQSILPLKTNLITDRTLFSVMERDMGWWLRMHAPLHMLPVKTGKDNALLLHLIQKASLEKREKPRFIYAHFFMPHFPFLYDRYGHERDMKALYQEQHSWPSLPYLDYVLYVNGQLKKLVNTISRNDPKAVMIVMGDHGFRGGVADKDTSHYFQDLNAVYFPKGHYEQFYDSISCVNQFRVIFNALFDQHFPLIKDSSVFLDEENTSITNHH